MAKNKKQNAGSGSGGTGKKNSNGSQNQASQNKSKGAENGGKQENKKKSIPKSTNSNQKQSSKTSQHQQSSKKQSRSKPASTFSCCNIFLSIFFMSFIVAGIGIYFSDDAQTMAGMAYRDHVEPLVVKVRDQVNDFIETQFPGTSQDSVKETERRQNKEKEELKRKEKEKAEEERKRKEKKEAERKEKEKKAEEERTRKEKEEAERKEKEKKAEEERKRKEKEEAEKKEKEKKAEEERKRKEKEEAERKEKEKKAEEERKKAEEERKRKEKEEAERKEKEKKAEEERKRKEKEEAERREKEKKAEEERKRKEREEAERKEKEKKAEEERKRKEKEETERREKEKKAEEERKKKEREEAERKEKEKKAEEERILKQKEEAERKEKALKAEEERLRKEKEEAVRKEREIRAEEEKKRKEKEEADRKEKEKKAEEERKQKEKELAAQKEKERKAEEERKKKEKEEADRKEKEKREEEEKKKKEKETADRKEREKKAEDERKRKEMEEATIKDIKKAEEERNKKDKEAAEKKAKEKEAEEKNLDKKENEPYEFASITNANDFKIRDKIDEADELYENEDYEGAVRKYDDILRHSHLSPRAMYGKGLTLDKLGFKHMSNEYLEEAINFLNRLILLPDVPDELFLMAGRKLAERQHFRGWGHKAVTTFTLMIERFPNDVKLRCELGVTYMMISKNTEAQDVFEQVLQLNPDSGFAKVHLGFIFKTRDNDYEKAISFLKEGIDSGEEGTSDGRFYVQLGDSLLRSGQEKEARNYFKEAEKKGLFLSQWQRSLYNVDTLTGRPFWTPKELGYEKHIQLLEKNWKTIRDEGLALLDDETGAFVPEDENLRDTGDWKQFTLYHRGRKNADNCAKAPKTCALIEQIPPAKNCKRGQVKFSVMSPGIHVWPHTGPTNCRLRSHLGLVIPEGPLLRVLNETRTWTEGKMMTFDDSFEHEVWHKGTEWRLILIVDFWHPELTSKQRQTLSPI